jgi:hypothetical protein
MLSPWACPYIGGYPAWIQLSFTQHHHVNRTYAVLRHHNHHYTLLVVARKLSYSSALSSSLQLPRSLPLLPPERPIPLVPPATAAQLLDNNNSQ